MYLVNVYQVCVLLCILGKVSAYLCLNIHWTLMVNLGKEMASQTVPILWENLIIGVCGEALSCLGYLSEQA